MSISIGSTSRVKNCSHFSFQIKRSATELFSTSARLPAGFDMPNNMWPKYPEPCYLARMCAFEVCVASCRAQFDLCPNITHITSSLVSKSHCGILESPAMLMISKRLIEIVSSISLNLCTFNQPLNNTGTRLPRPPDARYSVSMIA